MADDIVARLRERLARASIGDRMYERPMDWADADTLLAEIERLRGFEARLKGLVQCLLENDPDDVVADGGITVLMVWRSDAAHLLAGENDND